MWLQRLRTEDAPEVRAEFSAWVREGARNLEEFLFAQALWTEMDGIDPAMRERLWSAETPDSVISFPLERAPSIARPGLRTMRGWRKRFTGAGAAAAAMVCVLAGVAWWAMNRDTYVTAVGEQMTVKLPDGSMMHLNTHSRVAVNYSDKGRAIRLESGEALFTVARDPQRPFDVLTASARIRALGTEFNVRRSGAATRVAVVDGAVQVSAGGTLTRDPSPASGRGQVVQLQAGDEARVEPTQIVKASKPNIERAVSWRTRRLMFPGDPVGEIADEFNRYNKTTIRIEGPQLRMRRMSGVFDADDPSPLVRFLEQDPQIEVVRDRDQIVIRGRRSGGD